MKPTICATNKKQAASLRIVTLLLSIAPLWLMLAAADTSANSQTTSSPADWTQFLRDNMQRWNPYETVLSINNVGSLKLKWTNPVGNFDQDALSCPAVVNGVVFYGSGRDNNVYALNASTGAKLWSYRTNSYPHVSPAVVNGVVYIGDEHTLYALNAKTGVLLWSFMEPSPGPGPVELSSPAVANGVVYIGSDDGVLSALNAGTGAVLWQYNTGNRVDASPAVANGVVYFGSWGNASFYALDASRGTLLWSYAMINSVLFSAPAVANGLVYVVDQSGNLYALNASTGARLWSLATQYAVSLDWPRAQMRKC